MELLDGVVFSVSGFEMDLEVELTLMLVNVNSFLLLGGGGGGGWAGALREAIDSNRSFPVILTPKMVFATLEIFLHMLDFESRMSCLGLVFFLFMDVEKKIELKSPKTPHPRSPWHCQGGLREYARPPKGAKNRGILILRTHVSPHLGAEAWAQVVVALATHQLRAK